MKNIYCMTFAAACLLAAGCTTGQKPAELTAGITVSDLDTTALPGTDFYQYACGGWMKKNPLTDEYARYGTFNALTETTTRQIGDLIQELAAAEQPEGSIAQKIGTLYAVAMDSVKLNHDGIAPILPDLDEIAALSNKADVYALLAAQTMKGAGAYLGTMVMADDMNSSMNAVQISQSGLSMRDRDYYLNNDDRSRTVREAFKNHVEKMFLLAGYDEATAHRAMTIVMDVETRLARAYRSRVELRDPYANYNKMSMEEIRQKYPTFNWDVYLTGLGLTDVQEIIIGQPESLAAAARELHTLPLDQQKLYLQWKLINAAAGCLNDAMVEEDFDFNSRVMTGAQEMRPRWKRSVRYVGQALGQAVGQMYVERHFPAAAKERMIALVTNLQETLGERIQALEWMSDETKAKALEKLSTFHVKIGYPDEWKDYSTLEIKDDSYWANAKRARAWMMADRMSKAGQPVDPNEWFMTPQTVNAYYNPTTNEICFPAGILQPPFFDMNADDAFNYGAIGVVIGHEMTHGFDDQGRKYDKDGNLKDWWTEEDGRRFDERAKVMVDFFSAIEVAPGVHADGQMTLGENIADYGGLQVAFQSLQKATAGAPLPVKEGYTPEQRFFLAYAGLWSNNIRPEDILNRTKSDEHSLGKWRVNGALPQIDAWYEAFGITDADPMFVPKEERVSIW